MLLKQSFTTGIAAIIVLFNGAAHATCPQVVSAEDAIQVLTKMSPKEIKDPDRPCVSASIHLLGELRPANTIPLLISYLSYHREQLPGEKDGFVMNTPIEGNEYPAIVALSQEGDDARIPLLVVVESEGSSQLERNNAAHAILATFLNDGGVSEGIKYLHNAATRSTPDSKKNVGSALAYLRGVPACLRSPQACSDVDQ